MCVCVLLLVNKNPTHSLSQLEQATEQVQQMIKQHPSVYIESVIHGNIQGKEK